MSPVAYQTAAEAERTVGAVSPQSAIPHIVLTVTGKDRSGARELLSGSTLPPLDQVGFT